MVALGPLEFTTAQGRARLLFTTRAEGDFNRDLVAPAERRARQRDLVDLPWTMLDEVHGCDVVTVARPGDQCGSTADAAVTSVAGGVLGIWVGDCAPVALVADGGVGAAHAGWRGLVAGVLPATLAALRRLGATNVFAVVGPHIRPCCYEFGVDDLDAVAAALGGGVRSTTTFGTPALDLLAGIRASLATVGVEVADPGPPPCTACDPRYWSHRGGGDLGRQAMAVWLEGPALEPSRLPGEAGAVGVPPLAPGGRT